MFRNLLVLLIVALSMACTLANKVTTDPAAVAAVHKNNFKLVDHKVLKETAKPLTKENAAHVQKLSSKMMKKAKNSMFKNKAVTEAAAVEKTKKPFNRNVAPAEISVASADTTASGKAANKVLMQVRTYYGSSCDESYVMSAAGTMTNACMPEDNTFYYSWYGWSYSTTTTATSVSVLKSTVDGTSYATAVQTYFPYSDCYYADYNSKEISDTVPLDTCQYYYEGWNTYSYKYSLSNDMPTSTTGVYMNEYQGLRACNYQDQNGIKSYAFVPTYDCMEDEDGGSFYVYCSWGSPYIVYYTDSACNSSYYSYSYQLDAYSCYDSDNRYNYFCQSA